MADIEKLNGLADAATPWTELGSDLVEVWSSRDGYFTATELDMQFIAAANPVAVLELIAEVARWKALAANQADRTDVASEMAKEMREERDQLKAENEALRKNATRYEWLRDGRHQPGCLSSDPSKAKWLNEYLMRGEKLDAAIDEQLAKVKQS